MKARMTAVAICVLFTATDCAWDAAPNSDFITRGAGESVANMQVQQAREMWPTRSLDNDIAFDAERFVSQYGSAARRTSGGSRGADGSGASQGQQ